MSVTSVLDPCAVYVGDRMELARKDDDEEEEEYDWSCGPKGTSSPAEQGLLMGLSGDNAGPPELRQDHGRCIVHFDIDSFYAQVRDPVGCCTNMISDRRPGN